MKQNLDFRRPTVDDIIMKGTLAFWEAIYSRAKSLNGNWRETTVEQSSVVQNYSLPLQARLARSAQQTFAFRWRPCWRQFAGLCLNQAELVCAIYRAMARLDARAYMQIFSCHRKDQSWCWLVSTSFYKNFQDFPSHRIFRRMHEALNINKK